MEADGSHALFWSWTKETKRGNLCGFWAFCVNLGVWADAVILDIWADTDLPDLTTTTTTTGSMQLILNFRQIMNVTWNILTLRSAYLK